MSDHKQYVENATAPQAVTYLHTISGEANYGPKGEDGCGSTELRNSLLRRVRNSILTLQQFNRGLFFFF